MSVRTIKISKDEFKELIACKRKLRMIEELRNKNVDRMKETNRMFAEKLAIGDVKACEKLLEEQNAENIMCLAQISMILLEE